MAVAVATIVTVFVKVAVSMTVNVADQVLGTISFNVKRNYAESMCNF